MFMRADIPGNGIIEFEGRTLTDGAKYFESAPFYTELSPEVKEWLLDLRYAWARERLAPSELVLRACDEIESRIYTERERIFAELPKVFPKVDPKEACSDWLADIMTMRKCAEGSNQCNWTMRPLPGEVAHFLGVTMRVYRSMIATQNAQRSRDQQIPTPPVLDFIESSPEEEQIAFINSVMDGLSVRKAN